MGLFAGKAHSSSVWLALVQCLAHVRAAAKYERERCPCWLSVAVINIMIKNNLGKAFVLYFLINIHCGGDSGQELQREQSKPGGVAHTFNPSSRDEEGS